MSYNLKSLLSVLVKDNKINNATSKSMSKNLQSLLSVSVKDNEMKENATPKLHARPAINISLNKSPPNSPPSGSPVNTPMNSPVNRTPSNSPNIEEVKTNSVVTKKVSISLIIASLTMLDAQMAGLKWTRNYLYWVIINPFILGNDKRCLSVCLFLWEIEAYFG